jgi:ribose transport system ATP-binding protein
MKGDVETSLRSDRERPLLQLSDVSKTFGKAQVLRSVDLALRAGEVHALLGVNGSGKSTLIKILTGVYQADPGAKLAIGGRAPRPLAEMSGEVRSAVRCVHQDLGLVEQLSVMDNIGLVAGFATTGRLVSRVAQARSSEKLLQAVGVSGIDVLAPMRTFTPLVHTQVAIARSLGSFEAEAPGVLVLDEPTANLPDDATSRVFDLVREVRGSGNAVLYVTHRLAEVFDLCDVVTVLRQGAVVHMGPVSDLDQDRLVSLMIGREFERHTRRLQLVSDARAPSVVVRGLKVNSTTEPAIDFDLMTGEVVGIAGLVGSGAEKIGAALGGATTVEAGTVTINGITLPLSRSSPASLRRLGISYVPARRSYGVIRKFSVKDNIGLRSLRSHRWRSFLLSERRLASLATNWIAALRITPTSPFLPLAHLSGGNQQKALLARELSTGPTVLVVQDPTSGVDVASRRDIHELLRDQAADGLTVIVTSSDIEDLVELCDRILVVKGTTIEGQLFAPNISESSITAAIQAKID